MKAAFIGMDLFLPALEALEASGADIIKIFTCETDNVTEFNHKVIRFAKDRKRRGCGRRTDRHGSPERRQR